MNGIGHMEDIMEGIIVVIFPTVGQWIADR